MPIDATKPWNEGLSFRLLIGDKAIWKALPVIEELRRRSLSSPDPITRVEHFLSRTAIWNNTPAVVILNHHGSPFAAALFSMERRWGVQTGVVRGGNGTGDGLLVVSAGARDQAVAAAISALLSIPWVHTVLVSLRGGQVTAQDVPRLADKECRWLRRPVGTDLPIKGGFESFLSSLGPRTRRNYRYYRRRARTELGLAFVPELTAEEAAAAVEQLHAVARYPAPRSRTFLQEAAIRNTPGSFAMGLRTIQGRWISYLAGWRDADTTYVEWQLNDHREHAASVSTVMRTDLIEHECERHIVKLVFVGGTTTALERYCVADECLDLLVMRKGLRGAFGRALIAKLSPNGQIAKMVQASA